MKFTLTSDVTDILVLLFWSKHLKQDVKYNTLKEWNSSLKIKHFPSCFLNGLLSFFFSTFSNIKIHWFSLAGKKYWEVSNKPSLTDFQMILLSYYFLMFLFPRLIFYSWSVYLGTHSSYIFIWFLILYLVINILFCSLHPQQSYFLYLSHFSFSLVTFFHF